MDKETKKQYVNAMRRAIREPEKQLRAEQKAQKQKERAEKKEQRRFVRKEKKEEFKRRYHFKSSRMIVRGVTVAAYFVAAWPGLAMTAEKRAATLAAMKAAASKLGMRNDAKVEEFRRQYSFKSSRAIVYGFNLVGCAMTLVTGILKQNHSAGKQVVESWMQKQMIDRFKQFGHSVAQHNEKIKIRNRMRKWVKANIELSQKARKAHNENGLNYDEHKFTSKNFDRLMEQRGKTKEEAREIKQSFNKWADKDNKDPKMSQDVTAKHSPPGGDRAYVYSNKDGKSASGNYASPKKMYRASTAKKKLATPAYNKATQREEVFVHGDQIRGTVAPQKQFTEDARKIGDNVERKGGGKQIYTNGGFASGAVRSQDGTKSSGKTQSKIDEFGVALKKTEKSHNTSKEHSRGR